MQRYETRALTRDAVDSLGEDVVGLRETSSIPKPHTSLGRSSESDAKHQIERQACKMNRRGSLANRGCAEPAWTGIEQRA
jgi:hypothetical protein